MMAAPAAVLAFTAGGAAIKTIAEKDENGR